MTTTKEPGKICGGKSNSLFFYIFPFFSLNTLIFLSLVILYRTIDHTECSFNLPTEFNASGQAHVLDEEDKVKIKVDPTKMNLEGIETSQLEEVVDGWFKYVSKIFREACEKVRKTIIDVIYPQSSLSNSYCFAKPFYAYIRRRRRRKKYIDCLMKRMLVYNNNDYDMYHLLLSTRRLCIKPDDVNHINYLYM